MSAPTTIQYAQIHGEQYAKVKDLAAALRAEGFPNVAEWLEASANGPIASVSRVKVNP